MKSLILRPKINIGFEALMPEEIGEKWVCFPSVGSLYVKQYAKNKGHHCDYLDAEALDLSFEQAAQKAAVAKYDLVALPADTYSFLSTIWQAKQVRKLLPKAKLVCGGVHPTIYPEQTAALPWFDFVVFGDGERPFTQLLEALDTDSDPKDIPGIAFESEGHIVSGPIPELEKNLDDLGFPDFSDIPLHPYFSSLAKARPAMPMVTSRGCPFRCTFCDRPKLAHKLRYRSADHVLAEMEHLIQCGVTEFSIYDDTFTANKKRALEILDRMNSLSRRVGFDIRSRVDTTGEHLLDELSKAGCERVYIGVETGDPEMQKKIKKNIDLDTAKKVFKQVQQRQMKALAYFMIGLPGETAEQANRTIDYARKLAADFYLFEVFVPMPATEAYEQGQKQGILKEDYWASFAENPTEDFVPRLWEEKLTKSDLFELIRKAYKRVYLHPAYLWRSLIRTATWEEFKQKAKGGLSFLRLLK